MGLQFRVITKFGHAENLRPNKYKWVIGWKRTVNEPIHTGEEARMGTLRVLGGCKTRPIATATLTEAQISYLWYRVQR
jgi:hypothetical protein